MRILLFTTAHNALSQRAYLELVERGHTITIQVVSAEPAAESMMEKAVSRFQPHLIITTFLKKSLPANIQHRFPVLSLRSETSAGNSFSPFKGSVLEIWQNISISISEAAATGQKREKKQASYSLRLRSSCKNNFYRHHVAQAAIQDLLKSVEQMERIPTPTSWFPVERTNLSGRLHQMVC